MKTETNILKNSLETLLYCPEDTFPYSKTLLKMYSILPVFFFFITSYYFYEIKFYFLYFDI